jgi:DNA-binding IclR family transcriptional regulator
MDLMRRTGETVFLGALSSDRTSIVYVDKVESAHIIRYAGGVGDRRPLHATSIGKIILAFLPPEEREDILRSLSLARHTERTVTSLPALRASLEEIRRDGLSVTVDELVPGASGIAAPVFDAYGRVAGACAIGGPTDRVRPRLRALAREVKATASAVSARLGHHAHDDRRTSGRTP